MTTTNILRPSSSVPSSQFSWDGPTRTFVAEASDLGPDFRLTQVYNDSADQGFAVTGRNGEEIILVLDHEEVRDGDLLFWTFSIIAAPKGTPRVQFKVFND